MVTNALLDVTIHPVLSGKDTNRKIRKIRKNEFIYNCGSKNGSSSSTVNTGEV